MIVYSREAEDFKLSNLVNLLWPDQMMKDYSQVTAQTDQAAALFEIFDLVPESK